MKREKGARDAQMGATGRDRRDRSLGECSGGFSPMGEDMWRLNRLRGRLTKMATVSTGDPALDEMAHAVALAHLHDISCD